jgi:hypothetical protein
MMDFLICLLILWFSREGELDSLELDHEINKIDQNLFSSEIKLEFSRTIHTL